MENTQVISSEWKYKYNYIPCRKSAYFTIENDGMEIDAKVKGWLDANLNQTAKSKAAFILARRFSYTNRGKDGVNQIFAIALEV